MIVARYLIDLCKSVSNCLSTRKPRLALSRYDNGSMTDSYVGKPAKSTRSFCKLKLVAVEDHCSDLPTRAQQPTLRSNFNIVTPCRLSNTGSAALDDLAN